MSAGSRDYRRLLAPIAATSAGVLVAIGAVACGGSDSASSTLPAPTLTVPGGSTGSAISVPSTTTGTTTSSTTDTTGSSSADSSGGGAAPDSGSSGVDSGSGGSGSSGGTATPAPSADGGAGVQ